jgi:glycosyltransferase involved in cell wall biosynthesis
MSRLQILISAVNKEPRELLSRLNLQTDAVLVNQITDRSGEGRTETLEQNGNTVKVVTMFDKGVGLSRNTAFDNSDSEIIQFGDDDIVYDTGYASRVLAEFDRHPEADVLLFNVVQQPGRETYYNRDFKKVGAFNYGRYPAYAICARRSKIAESGVRYSLLFGGGAPYMNGEDSLFLHDLLKAGLQIYRTSVEIGHELATGTSTWFEGYTEKFFFDRGVLYHFLYGKAAFIWGFRFLFKNRVQMCSELGFMRCYGLLLKGVRHGKTLKKV